MPVLRCGIALSFLVWCAAAASAAGAHLHADGSVDVTDARANEDARDATLVALASTIREGLARSHEDTVKREADAEARAVARDVSLRGEMNAVLATIGQMLADLLDAVPTRASAARIAECALASTWYLDAPPKSCTAFAYQSHAAAPRVFVSAAHCIVNRTLGDTVTLYRLGDTAPTLLVCSIALLTASPDDTLILACPHAGNVPGYSASSASFGSAAAATGFAPDVYGQGTRFHLPTTPHVALNIRFSKLGNVAGKGLINGSCVVPASDKDTEAWPVTPAGFMDEAIVEGMSGGPLLDMQCGVLGVIHGTTCGASVYINLATADAFVQQQQRQQQRSESGPSSPS